MSDLETYSDYFYESQLIQSKKSANQILPIIEDWFSPSSIIDVGCGVGAWLEQWKQINPEKEVTGYDADFVNESLLLIKPEEFVTTDLNETIKSSSKAELLMCLEVAEHLNEKRADSFISDLTSLSDVILFSAAIPGQEGTHHINEQFIGYWIDLFKKYNFQCYDVLRPKIWDNEEVLWWYRQNIVLFIKNGNDQSDRLKSLPNFNGYDMIQKELFIHKSNKIDSAIAQLSKQLRSPLFYLYSVIRGLKNRLK